MDRQDISYLISVAMIAVGAGMYHVGAGFICGGIGIGLPFVISMISACRRSKG